MTDQEKNKIIAIEFLGYEWDEGSDGTGMFMRPAGKGTYEYKRKGELDFINTNASFDLLDELVKRPEGYNPSLKRQGNAWVCRIEIYHMNAPVFVGINESKSRAIVEAILLMIEKEKEK